ncbi:hypothetical protein ABIA33_004921 [Streptacidiphilus sp. MAP12-16]|uniref:alkylmercury lyase n=1 Tax=Streptacidiphilus sp. MAP12-16 TaxID=3156300 RepID=UPI003517692B
MRVTAPTVPNCPNALVLQKRITTALDGRSASLDLVEVTTQDEAARWGMTGSPTVLIDGVDPFASPGAAPSVSCPAPSVSCRLYRGADGRVEGSPGEGAAPGPGLGSFRQPLRPGTQRS